MNKRFNKLSVLSESSRLRQKTSDRYGQHEASKRRWMYWRPWLLCVFLAVPGMSWGGFDPRLPTGEFFIGFWEGIDPVDGSTVQFSISDVDQDDVLDALLRESFFFTCESDENTRGRGHFVGRGVVVNGILELNMQRLCVNDDGSVEEPEAAAFPLIPADGSSILTLPQQSGRDIILHRTSR